MISISKIRIIGKDIIPGYISFFNSSLCIFGLALDENETFLRWLLIERAKYFRRFPERRKKGWYVCKSDEISEGKRFYLDYLGFEMVTLENYEEIYKGLLEA